MWRTIQLFALVVGLYGVGWGGGGSLPLFNHRNAAFGLIHFEYLFVEWTYTIMYTRYMYFTFYFVYYFFDMFVLFFF